MERVPTWKYRSVSAALFDQELADDTKILPRVLAIPRCPGVDVRQLHGAYRARHLWDTTIVPNIFKEDAVDENVFFVFEITHLMVCFLLSIIGSKMH